MPRDLEAAMLAALTASPFRPVYFIEIETKTTTMRFWTGIGDKSWDGRTWTGSGQLLSISPIEDVAEIAARGVTFIFSRIPADLLALIKGDIAVGKSAKVWFGALDVDGNVIADPSNIFTGRVDASEVEEGKDTATIHISAESELILLNSASERRYTHEDQQINFLGDLGFEYMQQLQTQQELPWGDPSVDQVRAQLRRVGPIGGL